MPKILVIGHSDTKVIREIEIKVEIKFSPTFFVADKERRVLQFKDEIVSIIEEYFDLHNVETYL
jgi:hypothetical protein